MRFRFSLFVTIILFLAISMVTAQRKGADGQLKFTRGEAGSFTFNTGVLKGVLRMDGESIGLVPVTYIADSTEIASNVGLFNHYRVFTRGKRYGYGARRWPSTAELHADGSVEVVWPVVPERPFELRATYRWIEPNTLDLITVVHAEKKLEAFEVFLASYYESAYKDSKVWGTRNHSGSHKAGFVSADRELGEWLAFPRDKLAEKVITDGRWTLEPHPLEWTILPSFDLPLAIRRNTRTGLTVISTSRSDDCFAIFTPYSEESHISNYLSLFGYDIDAGETAKARSRLIVLFNPTETEILQAANEFLDTDFTTNK